MAKWIDCMDFGVGAIGYLASTDNSNTRSWNVLSLRERPLRTNVSREPRLHGWCGETNNVSRTAMGVWKVVKTNAAGDRAQIVQVTGADLAAFLERDGYPELIPADLRATAE